MPERMGREVSREVRASVWMGGGSTGKSVVARRAQGSIVSCEKSGEAGSIARAMVARPDPHSHRARGVTSSRVGRLDSQDGRRRGVVGFAGKRDRTAAHRGFTASLANGVVTQRVEAGTAIPCRDSNANQARSLRAWEPLRTGESRSDERTEQPDSTVQVPTLERSPTPSRPDEALPPRWEGATSPGTGVTRRLLMEETRVLSSADCHRSSTSAGRARPRFESAGWSLGRCSKGA